MEMNGRNDTENLVGKLVLCLLGGYVSGCMGMNLYWKYTTRAAASAFYISVYAGSVHTIQVEDIFWHILLRDAGILSLTGIAGLVSWGKIVIGSMLVVTGFVLGILTSGVLLTEGVYWWLTVLVWMLPCFLCSGSIIGKEVCDAWRGKYCFAGRGKKQNSQYAKYGLHICFVALVTVILARAESFILYFIFTKT